MAEAKAEVMEEIEDGREEAEEEDSVDATSVRPGRMGAGRDRPPTGLGSCEGGRPEEQEGFLSVSPQLGGHWLPCHRLSWHVGQGVLAGPVNFQERPGT